MKKEKKMDVESRQKSRLNEFRKIYGSEQRFMLDNETDAIIAGFKTLMIANQCHLSEELIENHKHCMKASWSWRVASNSSIENTKENRDKIVEYFDDIFPYKNITIDEYVQEFNQYLDAGILE